jgi:hypothetical protein
MIPAIPRDVLNRVKKLVLLPEEVKQSRWAVSITRLTSLKSLCQDPAVANRFVTYLARKTLERLRQGQGRSAHPDTAEQRLHQQLMADALAEMDAYLAGPTAERQRRLRDLLGQMRQQQNEFKNISWGAVRLIHDWELLLFEYAVSCLVSPAREAPALAYQTARHYAERYNPSEGTGLITASVPLVQDVADFWVREFGIDVAALTAPARATRTAAKTSSPAAKPKPATAADQQKPRFTPRQGQFLAFIRLYRKMHRRGPAEQDLERFFRVTPPAVHGMLVKLEELGLITREPGVYRSARVTVPDAELPPLEDVEGPPW